MWRKCIVVPKAKLQGSTIDSISNLPHKGRGRPLILGSTLDSKVQAYLTHIRDAGGAVNAAIVLAAAKAIILKSDKSILVEYGGHIVLTKDWAKSLLRRMGFVKRRGTTSNLEQNRS